MGLLFDRCPLADFFAVVVLVGTDALELLAFVVLVLLLAASCLVAMGILELLLGLVLMSPLALPVLSFVVALLAGRLVLLFTLGCPCVCPPSLSELLVLRRVVVVLLPVLLSLCT